MSLEEYAERIVRFPPYTALEEHFLNVVGAEGYETAVIWLRESVSQQAFDAVMQRVVRRNIARLRGPDLDPSVAHIPTKRYRESA